LVTKLAEWALNFGAAVLEKLDTAIKNGATIGGGILDAITALSPLASMSPTVREARDILRRMAQDQENQNVNNPVQDMEFVLAAIQPLLNGPGVMPAGGPAGGVFPNFNLPAMGMP
jgi:hypothetical protein